MTALAYRSEPQLAACLLTRAHHSAPKPCNPAERKECDARDRDYRREVALVLWRVVPEGVEL